MANIKRYKGLKEKITRLNCWIFLAYKSVSDYPSKPFFTKVFTNHGKMKLFSAKHSSKNKRRYPKYCSDYVKHSYGVEFEIIRDKK